MWKPTNYTFRQNVIRYLQACVKLPYVIAVGQGKLNLTLNSLECYNCCLYTFINVTVPIDFISDTLFFLKQRLGFWLPVNLTRPWEEGPMAGLM